MATLLLLLLLPSLVLLSLLLLAPLYPTTAAGVGAAATCRPWLRPTRLWTCACCGAT